MKPNDLSARRAPRDWTIQPTLVLIMIGQLVSAIGSSLSGFALGVWVYQRTGSVSQFSLISLCAVLPGVLFGPLAGTLVDRWDRRTTLLLSNCGAALASSVLVLLLATGRISMAAIYVTTALIALNGAFLVPAFIATLPLLVSREQLGRLNGVAQLAPALAQLISPALAGTLVLLIGIQGVLLLDLGSFLFAAMTWLLVRLPPRAASDAPSPPQSSLWRAAAAGWAYLRARPGLLALQLMMAANNFLFGMIIVLFTPLALSFASPAVVGTVVSIASSGMLAGSLLLTLWGGPQQRMRTILRLELFAVLCIILGGLRPSAVLLCVAAFGYLFVVPIINGCIITIVQRKVAPEMHGRVLGIGQMITTAASPLAYLLAGPLADRVFEPLMAVGGPLAPTIGRIIGVGQGRGIALLCIVAGLLTIPVVLASYLYPPLRLIEQELPETLPD